MTKKLSFAAIAVLAALLVLASCDALVDTGKEEVRYTEDGRLMVKLSVKTDSSDSSDSRALMEDLAKNAVDYFEVVFYDNNTTKYYRTSWHKGESARLYIPVADYDGTTAVNKGKAVVLAGNYAKMTLLATGKMTSTNVTAGTTSVSFTLKALETDVKNDEDNSFQIVSPTGFRTPDPTTGDGNHHETTINGVLTPYFTAPSATATVAGKFAIDNLDWVSGGIVGKSANGKIYSAGIASGRVDLPPITLADGTVTVSVNGTVTSPLDFTLGAPLIAGVGLTQISIEVPVVGINTSANGETWYIRGGLNSYLTETGAANKSTGGSIVLVVGLTPVDIGTGW